MFMFALRAAETKRMYTRKLRAFFTFLELQGELEEQAKQFVSNARKDANWTLVSVMRFISFQRERVARMEIGEATLRNYHKPIKLFCEMNDLHVNWKKVTRGLPRVRRASPDRIPTIDEIRKLVDYPDRRIKPIVYTMVSSGIRVGAWDSLRWGDIEPTVVNEKLVAASMVVYSGETEQYSSFLTSEAFRALKEWMEYRAESGEKITRDSWVMRNLWNAQHYHHGLARYPKKLKSSGVKRLIERALWAQGIRKPLDSGNKRHEFATDHGFRKFFKTRAEQGMRPANVEILMGHSIGISDHYYRPSKDEMLDDYLRAVPYLTISREEQLQLEVESVRIENKGEYEQIRKDYFEIKQQLKEEKKARQKMYKMFVADGQRIRPKKLESSMDG